MLCLEHVVGNDEGGDQSIPSNTLLRLSADISLSEARCTPIDGDGVGPAFGSERGPDERFRGSIDGLACTFPVECELGKGVAMRDQEPRKAGLLGLGDTNMVDDPAITGKGEEMEFSWPGGGDDDTVSVGENGGHCCGSVLVCAPAGHEIYVDTY